MKILHYILGFPPARSGGLVRYSIDLIEEQSKKGHEVIVLYPGNLNFIRRNTYIKKANYKGINAYQIVNSLPLPLFGGIKNPKDFMQAVSKNIYKNFLIQYSPHIIHVHTLMGIHLEFFESAKELGIPIIFTSHDYFGLAPEPNFFYDGKSYDDTNTVYDWIYASNKSMSKERMRVFQLKLYPLVKKILKHKKKEGQLVNTNIVEEFGTNEKYSDYKSLKSYYFEIFDKIDKYHFNSNLAKDIYKNNLNKKIDYEIITISNSRIERKYIRKNKSKKIRIAYIGPDEDYKGFFEFEKLSHIMKNDSEFEFHTYGYIPRDEKLNMIQHGKYSPNQVEKIFSNIDILIVPSKWKETFGLIVLEGLSFGAKVYSSRNVGASELVSEKNKFNDIEELRRKIINDKNDNYEQLEIKNMAIHESEIFAFYQEVRSLNREYRKNRKKNN